MEALLYAEIYLFCIIIVWLCKYWSDQRSSNSTSERWLHVALVGFLISFISNFLFTLVNRVFPVVSFTRHASWLLKTLYHIMLCFGVFAWCGYADAERAFYRGCGLQACARSENHPLRAEAS
jgi:hypothetical protein